MRQYYRPHTMAERNVSALGFRLMPEHLIRSL
jgi:hypothetical protein